MAANSRKHYYANPELTARRRRRYNANLRNASGYCDESDLDEIRRKQKGLCAYCGCALGVGAEVDHKTPLSRGGTKWPENLALACRTCNRDKHNKTAEEFSDWREELGLEVRKRRKRK